MPPPPCAAAMGKPKKGAVSTSCKSLSNIRRRDASRVKVQQSATVSMLTKFLDDDDDGGGGGKKKKTNKMANKRGGPSSSAGAKRKVSASSSSVGGGRGGSGAKAGRPSFGGGSGSSSSNSGGGKTEKTSAWSDVISSATAAASSSTGAAAAGNKTPSALYSASSLRRPTSVVTGGRGLVLPSRTIDDVLPPPPRKSVSRRQQNVLRRRQQKRRSASSSALAPSAFDLGGNNAEEQRPVAAAAAAAVTFATADAAAKTANLEKRAAGHTTPTPTGAAGSNRSGVMGGAAKFSTAGTTDDDAVGLLGSGRASFSLDSIVANPYLRQRRRSGGARGSEESTEGGALPAAVPRGVNAGAAAAGDAEAAAASKESGIGGTVSTTTCTTECSANGGSGASSSSSSSSSSSTREGSGKIAAPQQRQRRQQQQSPPPPTVKLSLNLGGGRRPRTNGDRPRGRGRSAREGGGGAGSGRTAAAAEPTGITVTPGSSANVVPVARPAAGDDGGDSCGGRAKTTTTTSSSDDAAPAGKVAEPPEVAIPLSRPPPPLPPAVDLPPPRTSPSMVRAKTAPSTADGDDDADARSACAGGMIEASGGLPRCGGGAEAAVTATAAVARIATTAAAAAAAAMVGPSNLFEPSAASGGTNRGKKKKSNNDNFVRLNLRNSAGSCRGARNKNKKRRTGGGGGRFGGRYQRFGGKHGRDDFGSNDGGGSIGSGGNYKRARGDVARGEDYDESANGSEGRWRGDDGRDNRNGGGGGIRLVQNASAVVDPLDDYLDGTYTAQKTRSRSVNKATAGKNCERGDKEKKKENDQGEGDDGEDQRQEVPRCVRHQRPCKLLTVKKSGTGNKGRKFYVCGLPRGEQCDHFQWEDDTVQSTRRALLRSSSTSGFVARQVAAYVDRYKSLTLPELRDEAKRRGLRHVGKKGEVLARLTIWVRDEVAKTAGKSGSDRDALEGVDKENGEENARSVDGQRKDSESSCETNYSNNDHDDATSSDEDDGSEDDDSDSDSSSSCDELELIVDDTVTDNDNNKEGEECEESVDGDDLCTEPATDPSLRDCLKKYFGYSTFRNGQEWAIRRVLSQQRSLLVAPTGLGKSLCYALPAALMDGVCLVVSPLISLMQDQLRHLPPNIPAATLSGAMSSTQMAMTVDDLIRNRLKVLFVSPERLASAAFRRLIRPRYNPVTKKFERQFPPISLLCIDEAHCLSQWGHNFRPSYLRIRSLVPQLQPNSILALTATAGPMVIRDICHTLSIPMGDGVSKSVDIGEDVQPQTIQHGVKVLNCNRDNIDVAALILEDEDSRRAWLYKILKDTRDASSIRDRRGVRESTDVSKNGSIQPGCLKSGSVIVYVWRQRDAETVAEQLIGAGVEGGVVFYHGGMDAYARARSQGKFMRGKARICVATVAFGLGINKSNIRGVVHMCLPPSLEHYLQEIGRAGRDGSPARAIALVLSDEVKTRHSLAHSDGIAKSQLEKLCLIIRGCVDDAIADASNDTCTPDVNAPHEMCVDVALPVSSTVDAVDCKEETVETILSLLEEDTSTHATLLSVEGHFSDQVIVTLKRRTLEKLCSHEAIARAISKCGNRLDQDGNPLEQQLNTEGGTAMQRGFIAYSFGTYQFSVVKCARFLGPKAEPRHVFAALRRLQTCGELELALDRTPAGKAIHLRFNMAGIECFRSPDSPPAQVENGNEIAGASLVAVGERLHSHCCRQERTGVVKVEKIHEIIHRIAAVKCDEHAENNALDADECTGDACSNSVSSDSSSNAQKSARLLLFQKLVRNYFRAIDLSQANATQIDGTDDQTSVQDEVMPLIAKTISATDSSEISQLAVDVSSLMRDPSLSKPRPYPIAVDISDGTCADYTSRCMAKVLHGIDSARAPLSAWFGHPLWGKWRHCTFSSVLESIRSVISGN